MKISVGADHGAVNLKEQIVVHLKSKGYSVIDRGTHGRESVDYPDFAAAVGADVASGEAQFGVLMCTTGIGISISANKIHGVRAALVHNDDGAEFSRLHNDANIICFGAKYDTAYMACRWLDIFLKTAFEGGRHQRRVDKMEALAAKRLDKPAGPC